MLNLCDNHYRDLERAAFSTYLYLEEVKLKHLAYGETAVKYDLKKEH